MLDVVGAEDDEDAAVAILVEERAGAAKEADVVNVELQIKELSNCLKIAKVVGMPQRFLVSQDLHLPHTTKSVGALTLEQIFHRGPPANRREKTPTHHSKRPDTLPAVQAVILSDKGL